MTAVTLQTGLLSDEQLEKVHSEAIDLAGRVGLLVEHEELLARLADYDGVRIAERRVHFQPHQIEKAVTSMQYPPSPPDFSMISGAYIIGMQDMETGELRRSTYDDLVTCLKLGQQLGLCGSPPVRPLDIPTHLQEIAMYRAAWEYTDSRPEPLFDTTPMSTVATAETIYEMAQAIGKPFSVGMYLISPFTCPHEGLDVIAAFLDRQVPMWVGTMPVAGLTGPIFMFGAHVQALAELMAGITLLYLLSEGKVPIYWTPIDSVRAHPFDMRHASFVYSSPEDTLGSVLQAQINKKYGVPHVAKSLLTSATRPDEQAGAEKAMHTLMAALSGARLFTNAGFLAIDEYVSLAQMVIDHEIVQFVRGVVKGLDVSNQAMSLDVIAEVSASGSSFIEHKSTYRHFREAAWDPPLFNHVPLRPSEKDRQPPLFERAHKMARAHIKAADYVLPESDRNILEGIYARAKASLVP